MRRSGNVRRCYPYVHVRSSGSVTAAASDALGASERQSSILRDDTCAQLGLAASGRVISPRILLDDPDTNNKRFRLIQDVKQVSVRASGTGGAVAARPRPTALPCRSPRWRSGGTASPSSRTVQRRSDQSLSGMGCNRDARDLIDLPLDEGCSPATTRHGVMHRSHDDGDDVARGLQCCFATRRPRQKARPTAGALRLSSPGGAGPTTPIGHAPTPASSGCAFVVSDAAPSERGRARPGGRGPRFRVRRGHSGESRSSIPRACLR